jgi:Zn-finger nucleic acid-binding protein
MARVSDRARFCHHCASPLIPAGIAGEPSEQVCPVCPDVRMLTSRQIGDPAIGVLECPTCAGLWLSAEELQLLLQRVRATSANSDTEIIGDPQNYRSAERVTQDGPIYRSCPDCGKLMHRRNFGRKSGIIVDQCGPHGYWFDNQELESILRWVQQGGELRVARLEDEERQVAARREQMRQQLEPADSDWSPPSRGSGPLIDMLSWLVRRIR